MVYDGSFLKFYKNGFLMNQVTATGTLVQNNWLTQIGFYQSAFYNTNLIGYVNEVRIWNVARSQAQLQAFMNSPLPSPATQVGLLAYYTFNNLLNKQGDAAWDGTLVGNASINQANPTCAAFVPDNRCCPLQIGTFSGNSICSNETGLLTFHSIAVSVPPFTLTYSDGTNIYVQHNVVDGSPFAVPGQPLNNTTTYTLQSIQDASGCSPTPVTGLMATIVVSKLTGTFIGNSVCPGEPGLLTFHPTATLFSPPYSISYSDGNSNYVQPVQDGVPFAVPVPPVMTTSYPLLKITDGHGCSTDITGEAASIIVKDMPRRDFTFDQSACSPFKVRFTGTSQPNTTYDWTINGIAYPNASQPLHDFGTAGNYAVTLVVTQAGGCVNTLSRNISIGVQSADIITTADTTICFGDSISLRTLAALEYCWSPGGDLHNPSSSSPIVKPGMNEQFFVTAKVRSTNLLSNGDFTLGNTGFISGYSQAVTGSLESSYSVGNAPAAWNASFSSCTDHTGANGNMLLVNGSKTSGKMVWSETIPAEINTNYSFSAWFQNISALSPARLQLYINGVWIENFNNPVSETCSWQRFTTDWNSGASATAVLSIMNTNLDDDGNDFALDDLSFTSLVMESEAVTVDVQKPVVLTSPDTIVCPGAQVSLRASGAASYSWSPVEGLSDSLIADPIALPTGNTSYVVNGTTMLGCKAKATVNVSLFRPIAVNMMADTSICRDSPAHLRAGGGIGYSWSPAQFLDDPTRPDPVATPNRTTRFVLQMTDGNSCTESDSVLVSILPVPNFQAPPDQQICQGFSVLLNSNNPDHLVYEWTPADFLDNAASAAPAASPDHTMNYSVKISDAVCSNYNSSFQVLVEVKPSPVVVAQKTNDVDCIHLFTRLNAMGAVSYSWFPAEGLNDAQVSDPVATIDTTTLYTVQGTSENGCYAFDSVRVNVKASGKNLFSVPNAFTPNNDGINDCFGIRKWGDVMIQEFIIYNRWGQKVFESRNPSDCWNGTFHGERQDTGGYVYEIRAVSFCGNIIRRGTVMLIR
jgi:gliding motility-associated-like protein